MSDAMIEGFRLSPQQQHVWALQQLDSAQPYRTQGTIVIEGSLDIDRLQASLLQVVQRYEILRTTFQYLQGMALPLQVVNELSELSLPSYDLNEHSLADLQTQLAQQTFDFGAGPMLHAWLGREHALKHYLLLSVPTLCADNLSLVNLTSELAAIYADEPTSDEPMQYIDIAEWQHELLEAEETAAGRNYWQQQTWQAAITVRPAFVANQTAAQAFQPQQLPIPLTEQLLELLEQASQTLAVPASAIGLAAWRTLLWRLSDQTNGVVGVVCDGRKYAELETTLGLFAKAVPLASPLAANQHFAQLVKQVQQEYVEAYAWQESFNWPSEVPSQLAFFPFGFEVLTIPKPLVVGELGFHVMQQHSMLNPYAAQLTWVNQPQGFAANLNVDAGLITVSTAERLIEQYQTLLTAALRNLDASLAQLPIVGTNERQQLLIEFNQTVEPFEPVRCFHELFSAQAAATPNHPAVMVDDQQLSYAELESRSNQLARALLARGVRLDQPVALALDRSLNLLVGMLGILKAGAAYVPLDLGLPKERLGFMLADIQASIVVSEASLQAQLPEHAADYLWLDQAWPTIAEHSTEPVAPRSVPANLMYIIYTSGSTGQPKGVGVSHQSLYNYLSSIRQRLNLPPQASFASVSTIAADLGHTAIFPTLANGGTLHLISTERASNASQLADYMQQHAVDCLKIVPSHLAALLSVAEPARVLPRQRLILGGEAVSWKLLQTIALLAPNCHVFNHYGPTETTVGVLTNPLSANLPSAQSAIPALGRPIANTQIYLLDVHGQPVPLGMAGELYVGGAALARGYWQRPAITAERFVPDGLSGQTGGRLYRTGDLARYLPDGTLEFLGRADDQVKIRGFRIELGEIEAALRNHAAIEQAAVIVRDDPAGDKRLVAYLVAGQQRPLSLRELRSFLKQSLPDYMVPAAFVMLERLPLNPNGKLDRQALPAPEQQQAKASTQIVAPRTPVETTLVEIWSQVLGGKPVGIHNNFFELGGDSILSIQIIARASQAGLKVTPKQLFDHPTIADLAQVVATTTAAQQAEQQLVTGPVPLTPIQHWFFEQELAEPQHYNQAVFFEVRFELDPTILAQVVPELVRHHDALRLRFSPSEQGWQQVNSADVAVKLLHINLADEPVEQQRQLMEQKAAELQTSLDLTHGPLLRMVLFELGANQPSRLLVIVHHLAIDTVSWQILFADLPLVYEQIRQQQPLNLPAKTHSFKDWAERLQSHARSAELEREVAYWLDPTRQQVRQLPVDYAAEAHANTVASTQNLSLRLSVEETKALLEVVPPVYNTQINDALLAALTQSISQWQGNPSVLVELEGHGREDIFADLDISRTVGWFTSRFPVLLQASKSVNAGDSLRSTKEQLRQIPQRGIGYGLLRYLRGDTQLSQQLANLPQPQLSFNYLGTVAHDVSQTGPLAWTSESSGPTRSPAALRRHWLDLTILVTDQMLQMNWSYSQALHSEATIKRVAERFVAALQAIIQHCQQPNAGGYTPSDFPSANLNQKNLDSFIAKLRNSENSTHES